MKSARERAEKFVSRFDLIFTEEFRVELAVGLELSFKEHARDMRHNCAERSLTAPLQVTMDYVVDDEDAPAPVVVVNRDALHAHICNTPAPGKEEHGKDGGGDGGGSVERAPG